jgi:hypothetical protein
MEGIRNGGMLRVVGNLCRRCVPSRNVGFECGDRVAQDAESLNQRLASAFFRGWSRKSVTNGDGVDCPAWALATSVEAQRVHTRSA